MSDLPEDRPLTPTELAEYLRISKRTLSRAVKSGRLDGWEVIRINARTIRFRRVESKVASSDPVRSSAP